MPRDLLWVSTLTVPATSEGHALLLQLLEIDIRLYHTGQAREGNFNLYAQLRSSQWKRFTHMLPEWVHASEKRAQAIKDERPLNLIELYWDFKEGKHASSSTVVDSFFERFSRNDLESPLCIRIAYETHPQALHLNNTDILYIPILKENRHAATQWLRRHHIPYALTHITEATRNRFFQEQEAYRFNEEHRIQQAY